MTHVVAEPCVGCTFTECVEVCPVDCFYVGPNFISIHPDECIDCGACVPECPVAAIFPEVELPGEWAHYTALNASLAPDWKRLGHNLIHKRDGSPLPSDLSCADRSRSAAMITM